MGQSQGKVANTENTTNKPETDDDAIKLFLNQSNNNIPRGLKDQVNNLLLNCRSPAASTTTARDFELQGFLVNAQVAAYVVSFLELIARLPPQYAIASLSVERDIEDASARDMLVHCLQHHATDVGLERLALSVCRFGSCHNNAARETCRALLNVKNDWRSLEFRHCNFVAEDSKEQQHPQEVDMSFVTDGLRAQTALRDFTLSHGMMSNGRCTTDQQLAEIMEILSTKKQTLRNVVLRDCYDVVGGQDVEGQATSRALVNLLQNCKQCQYQLDCRLEKLVWDIPCTQDLYRPETDLQKRFRTALLHNETMVSIQLRRMNLHAPLVKTAQACIHRNKNIQAVRATTQDKQLSLGELALALAKLAGLAAAASPPVISRPLKAAEAPRNRKTSCNEDQKPIAGKRVRFSLPPSSYPSVRSKPKVLSFSGGGAQPDASSGTVISVHSSASAICLALMDTAAKHRGKIFSSRQSAPG